MSLSLSVLSGAALLLSLLLYCAVSWRKVSLLGRLKGPASHHILWGNELQLQRTTPGSFYLIWKALYGDIYKIRGTFGKPILCISDSLAVAHILGPARWDFPKHQAARAWFESITGRGLLYCEEKSEHKALRRMIIPTLSGGLVKDAIPDIVSCASNMAVAIDQLVPPHDSLELDFCWWSTRYSLDVVCRAIFHWEFDAYAKNNSLADALDNLTNAEDNYSSFVMRALVWSFPWILKVPSDKGRQIQETRQQLDDLSRKMFTHFMNDETSENGSLLSNFKQSSIEKFGRIDEDYIHTQIRTILSAAFETVSATLNWIFFELAANAEVQDTLRLEVSGIELTRFGTYDLQKDFPLLDAVYKETLRVHPPVLELHHVAAKTLSIPIEGTIGDEQRLSIPQGTMIALPVNAIQSAETSWGDTAGVWDPRRWFDGRPTERLMAFSHGPRMCPGQTFASLELKALVVQLLRRFDFQADQQIEAFQSFVVRPRVHGHKHSSLPLRLRRIKTTD